MPKKITDKKPSKIKSCGCFENIEKFYFVKMGDVVWDAFFPPRN